MRISIIHNLSPQDVVGWLFSKGFRDLSTPSVDKHVENGALTSDFAHNGADSYKLPISKAEIFLRKIKHLAHELVCPIATIQSDEKYFNKRYNSRRCFL
jgi:hypothetical protein